MNYGNLFSRAWKLIWDNKALILLGMLAVLSGIGGGSGGSQGIAPRSDQTQFQVPPQLNFDLRQPWQGFGLPGLAIAAVLIAVLFALVLWMVGTIARGGLISGAVAADRGDHVQFIQAFRVGLDKGWRLIGIGLIPAAPVVLLVISALFSAGIFQILNGNGIDVPNAAPVLGISCLLIPLALGLSLLRSLANRACMLEDLSVWESYKRGFQVLGNNLGPAALLFMIQIAISLVMGLMLLAPLALSALCCLLWPVLWFVQGSFAAFYSTLWTLAWAQWTE